MKLDFFYCGWFSWSTLNVILLLVVVVVFVFVVVIVLLLVACFSLLPHGCCCYCNYSPHRHRHRHRQRHCCYWCCIRFFSTYKSKLNERKTRTPPFSTVHLKAMYNSRIINNRNSDRQIHINRIIVCSYDVYECSVNELQQIQ